MALNIATGSFQTGGGIVGTTYSATGLSFQPSCVILMWSATSDGAASERDLYQGIGWATGSSARGCIINVHDHAAADGEGDRMMRDDACIAEIGIGTGDPQTTMGLFDFDAFLSDGFRVIVDDQTVIDSPRIHYIALGGTDLTNVACGTLTAPTSATTLDVTGPGFQPNAILILGHGSPTVNSTLVDNHSSFGWATGTAAGSQAVLAGFSDDGPTSSDTAAYCKSGEVLAKCLAASVSERASLNAWLSNGFQLSFSEVDGTNANKYLYLALKVSSAFGFELANFSTVTNNGEDIVVNTTGKPKGVMFLSACRTESTSDTPTAVWTASLGLWASEGTQNHICVQQRDSTTSMDCWSASNTALIYVNPTTTSTQSQEGSAAGLTLDAKSYTLDMTDGDPSASWVSSLVLYEKGTNPLNVERFRKGERYSGIASVPRRR